MCVYMYTCVCIYTCVYACVCIYIHTRVCVCACMHICVYTERSYHIYYMHLWASQMALVVKNTPANAGDVRDAGSILVLGRVPRGGHG